MAATGTGISKVLTKRRFEDYASMKQWFQHWKCTEFIISGYGDVKANAQFLFTDGDTINYIAAEGQAYIRTEANDDPNQVGKYVYIEYCTEAGLIKRGNAVLAADTTTVASIGDADFFRLRQMISEVVSDTGGGKAVLLTDAVWGGADDTFGFIDDDQSVAVMDKYYVPKASQVVHTYLGRVKANTSYMAAAATAIDDIILTVAFTPKAVNIGASSVAVATTILISFNTILDWQPLIELEPATEVTFSWAKETTDQPVWFEATFLEVWVKPSHGYE